MVRRRLRRRVRFSAMLGRLGRREWLGAIRIGAGLTDR